MVQQDTRELQPTPAGGDRRPRRKARPEPVSLGLAQLELLDFDELGEATAYFEGAPVSVPAGIPGEVVTAELWTRRRGGHLGLIRSVDRPAPARVAAPCPYFGECGGCRWQHVAYPAQLAYKQGIVRRALARVGLGEVAVAAPIGMPEPWHYRNHARFSVRWGNPGYMRLTTHHFLPVERCLIVHPRIVEVLQACIGKLPRLHQLAVRVGVRTGELMVNPALPGLDLPFETGQPHLHEVIAGHRFRISGPAFFQVNTAQAERLVLWLRERLALTGSERVIDGYCGVGMIGICLSDRAREVVGIEESSAALKDAAVNAAGLGNIRFVLGKTEAMLASEAPGADVLILDPPRCGCHPDVLRAALAARPGRLAYVSCDPASLARDLRVLVDGGYRISAVQPFDMFPQTQHVETVVLLDA